ncbi:MAG: histidine kinase N-terminal 7TM domain-containing protein, partial [bacterium]
MDTINTLLSIIILVNLMLVVVSSSGYRNGDKSLVYSVYLLNITTIAWWTASTIFYRVANEGGIDFMMRNVYASATFIASSFYYFSFIFPDFRQEYRKKLVKIFLINIVLVFLITCTQAIITGGVIIESHENVAFLGKLFFIYGLYILYYLCSSFFRLFIKYLKTSRNDPKKFQLLYIFLGYTISGFLSFVADLLLPSFNNFEYLWVGPITTIFVAFAITYAVTRHHLFNIKMITTEIFVFTLWVFTLIKISAFENLGEFGVLVPLSFLLLSLTIGILLIKSVKKQAE